MKKLKMIITTLFTLVLLLSFSTSTYAATVDSVLKAPEEGWTRFDDRAPELVYSKDDWVLLKNSETTGDYEKTILGAKHKKKSEIKFKFEGSKIRLIIAKSVTYSKNVAVSIDGNVEYFSAWSENWIHQIVAYEKLDLDYGVHEVIIWTETPSSNVVTYDYRFDAIDIDGSLLDFNYVEPETPTDPEPTPEPEQPSNPDPQPEQPPVDRAILVVTMTTGLEKEYDLPMSDVNAFLNWYDARDTGTGPSKFTINKYNNNKGPFSKRTDYVIFDKILTFEVNEYSTN
ncbi:hypothetical protein GCM10008014_05630 [Paenibacillus silvae]|uniref:Uncharacterized protein n=1 Tax=Paenibacillus silvae TaxID=1325358 RepID=A0ABQ1Z1E5_9BACL|nr:hypothetical protein [Paenibacillus silvae]GGH44336.1 hypothetical protein GCM10008014_05630 [Paenibacillus silvae]